MGALSEPCLSCCSAASTGAKSCPRGRKPAGSPPLPFFSVVSCLTCASKDLPALIAATNFAASSCLVIRTERIFHSRTVSRYAFSTSTGSATTLAVTCCLSTSCSAAALKSATALTNSGTVSMPMSRASAAMRRAEMMRLSTGPKSIFAAFPSLAWPAP